MNRRNFLKAGALCGGAAATTGSAHGAKSNPSGVAGYQYRLPGFKEGTRLLFIGDSITDMKWGRNEKDRNHYLGHSYVYLIASRLGVDMPEA
ncbi:MAG: twin-arginine translocation signal domain-containing protein, partial [Verrucomicrobiales bacterium]